MERREAWKEEAHRIFLEKTREVIVNQTNVGTVLKATLGETSEGRGGTHMGFYEHIDATLN